MNKIKTLLLILFSVVILLDACAKGVSEKGDENASTKTVEMKTITDHAGNTVEIPVNPQRIASLHTFSTTIMLLELGAPIIGTATRPRLSTRKPYMRGTEELLDIKLENTDYYNYGVGGRDIEQIKLSNPDLIVGTVFHAKWSVLLSAIAPTIFVDNFKNMEDMNIFNSYRDLAHWAGKEILFDKKYKEYQKRVLELRAIDFTGKQ